MPRGIPTDVYGFYIDPRVGAYTVGLFVEKCWLLRARCAACGRVDHLTVARLLELPAGAQIGAVVARLKCRNCGGRQGFVDFLQDRGATAAKDAAAYAQRVKPGDKQ